MLAEKKQKSKDGKTSKEYLHAGEPTDEQIQEKKKLGYAKLDLIEKSLFI